MEVDQEGKRRKQDSKLKGQPKQKHEEKVFCIIYIDSLNFSLKNSVNFKKTLRLWEYFICFLKLNKNNIQWLQSAVAFL